MIKKDIIKLYKKNPKLAKQVAKALGYKITVKGENVGEPSKPSETKIKNDIKDMLKKELNTMKLGNALETWIEQLPDFASEE